MLSRKFIITCDKIYLFTCKLFLVSYTQRNFDVVNDKMSSCLLYWQW